MKKFLCGFFGVAASTAMAVDVLETTVDVTAINSPLTNVVVAISVLDLSTGGDLAISNLVKTTNLKKDDKLYAFDNGKYECWTLSADGGVWERMEHAYTISSTGSESELTGTDAALVRMAVGKGIWLHRQDPATSNPFYVYGAHAATKTSVVPLGVSAALVGNPTQTAQVPTSPDIVQGDIIAVPTEGKLKRYSWNGTSWGVYGSNGIRIPMSSIPAGTGFWYIPKAATPHAVTLNWQ